MAGLFIQAMISGKRKNRRLISACYPLSHLSGVEGVVPWIYRFLLLVPRRNGGLSRMVGNSSVAHLF